MAYATMSYSIGLSTLVRVQLAIVGDLGASETCVSEVRRRQVCTIVLKILQNRLDKLFAFGPFCNAPSAHC